jgi:serine/threonine-protein kinase
MRATRQNDGPERSRIEVHRRIFAGLQTPGEELLGETGFPRVKDYVLIRKLGVGGGGEVFYAIREDSDQPCALKLLHANAGGERAAQRVWRELDALRAIRLPIVPRVHDYGIHDGRLYIVTEYVEGLQVDEHAAIMQLDLRARVELLASIADAVHSLHQVGVLHRDLKPANVLVDLYGKPNLIDLGLAQLVNDVGEQEVHAPEAAGTLAYLAPEQARGESSAISTRTDVFGIGAIGSVLLTGRPPRDAIGDRRDLVRKAGHTSVPEPQTGGVSFPRALSGVLAKAMAFDANDRYESAAALAADLRRWLRWEPVQATRQSVWTRANLYRRRRPGAFATACAAIIFGCAAVGAIGWATAQASMRDRAEDLLRQQEALAAEKADLVKQGRMRTRDVIRENVSRIRRVITKAEADPIAGQQLILEATLMLKALGDAIRNGDFADDELLRDFTDAAESLINSKALDHVPISSP